MTRIRAFAMHIGASAALAGVLSLLAILVWYPSPLFALAKGRDIFFLLTGCDVVLGPVLTLVVFNVRKPRAELIRDLAVIVVVQIIAMVYGIATLLQARPAYIVYNAGQFNVSLANEIVDPPADGKAGTTHFLPWRGPKLVGVKLPQDPQERNRILLSAVGGQGDIFQMPQYFVNYDEVRPEVIAKAKTEQEISDQLHWDVAKVRPLMAQFSNLGANAGLLPLVVRHSLALAVVDRRNGDFLGILAAPSG